jgi:autophagy-related protein 9
LHKDYAHPAWATHDDDGDNDVPASLLVENREGDAGGTPGRSPRNKRSRAAAIPGPSKAHAQWETAQAHQRLHSDDAFEPSRRGTGLPHSLLTGVVSGSAKKKAEWRWANVSNLDNFIKDVYDYYAGHGIWCILVERVLHLV